jgi:hypothetical protein
MKNDALTSDATARFSYSGNLADQALPELLFKISQYKVPGVVAIRSKQIIKQIFVREGKIIFATSNAPEDHLGEFLFRCGKISRIDYDRSVELLSKNKGKWQGEILIDMKAISKEELPWAVRSHQQAIVWSVFNWFEGEVTFSIGSFRQSKPIQLDVPIPRAILDGVRNIHNAKKVISLLGSRHTVLIPESNSLLEIEMIGADEKEREIMKRVDGKTTLYDLCANAPYPAQETAKILYGLYTLRLLKREESRGIHILSTLPVAGF